MGISCWGVCELYVLYTYRISYCLGGCGHFLYYEASGRQNHDRAYAALAVKPETLEYCVKFYLSMYAAPCCTSQMGSFSLVVNQNSRNKRIFYHSGITTTNQSEWRNYNVDMTLFDTVNDAGVCMLQPGSCARLGTVQKF